MGYYEESWNELPKKIPYDAFLQLISVITHLILPLPMYFAKRNEEHRDIEQRKVIAGEEEYMANHGKHLIDLLFNYFVLFYMFTAYITIVILTR